MTLNENWTSYVVGQMHKFRISEKHLAQKCGFSAPYLSTILNGTRTFKSQEAKVRVKQRILFTLRAMQREIMEEIENGH